MNLQTSYVNYTIHNQPYFIQPPVLRVVNDQMMNELYSIKPLYKHVYNGYMPPIAKPVLPDVQSCHKCLLHSQDQITEC